MSVRGADDTDDEAPASADADPELLPEAESTTPNWNCSRTSPSFT